jgi:hypothetical protein
MRSDLYIGDGIPLSMDRKRSNNAIKMWHATDGSSILSAMSFHSLNAFCMLELATADGVVIVRGADFAECWHRLLLGAIRYRLHVALARLSVGKMVRA